MAASQFLASLEPTSIEEITEAIEKLAPEFEAEARASEIERQPTQALANLMRQAKLPLAKLPKEVGGCELRPSAQIDYFARLAYLNPTAGWIAFNQNGALGLTGATMAESGLEKLLTAHPVPLLAAVSAPTGRTKKVEGGYRLNGNWSYASGISCADCVLMMTICDDPAGPLGVLVDRNEVEVQDDWHVAALQGTGSVDISAKDVFVPTDMTLSPLAQRRGGSQYIRMGYRGYVGGENLGFTLGVAQRMVDEIAKIGRTKKRILDPTPIGDRGAFQQELGRTDAALRASRAYLMDELDRAESIADATGEPLADSDRARVDGAVAYATENIVHACMRLFPYAGAGALHMSSPIQRTFRDVVGSGQHIVASNETLDHWGAAMIEAAE